MKHIVRSLSIALLLTALLCRPTTALAAERDSRTAADPCNSSCTALTQNCGQAVSAGLDWTELCRQLLSYCGFSFSGSSCAQQAPSADEPALPTLGPSLNADNTSAGMTDQIQQVLDLINAERAAEGLSVLVLDDSLNQAAALRAPEIVEKFSHTRPDGSSCFTVLEETGVRYSRAGENLAIGQSTAAQAVQDWMNSSGHRANIMNGSYGRTGIAVIENSNGNGGYAWVQLFAD